LRERGAKKGREEKRKKKGGRERVVDQAKE